MAEFDMPVAFHFNISFSGDAGFSFACQEVSGLEASTDVTPLAEGGEARFLHQLPKVVKHPNLVLKRGVAATTAPLVEWCKATLEGGFSQQVQIRGMSISLLNTDAQVVAAWQVTGAYPVKWSVGKFDAMKNELAVETIELAYSSIKRSA